MRRVFVIFLILAEGFRRYHFTFHKLQDLSSQTHCMPSLLPSSLTMNNPDQLPLLPSVVDIPRTEHEAVALVILRVVEAHGLHIPPNKLALAHRFLWTNTGAGLFDGVYSKWAPARMNRQMKLRVEAIISRHHDHEEEYPSELQGITKRLFDERAEAVEKADTARAEAEAEEERIQAANVLREGTLGLLPRARVDSVPTVEGVSPVLRNQMVMGAALLAGNPRSQNNAGETGMSWDNLFSDMGFDGKMGYLEQMENHAHAFA